MKDGLRDEIVTEVDLSRLTGKSREWLRPRLGRVQMQGKGYRLADALPELFAPGKSTEESKLALIEAQTRKADADAIGSEIDNETKMKSRIPIEVCNEVMESALTEAKSILKSAPIDDVTRKHIFDELNSIPKRLKW